MKPIKKKIDTLIKESLYNSVFSIKKGILHFFLHFFRRHSVRLWNWIFIRPLFSVLCVLSWTMLLYSKEILFLVCKIGWARVAFTQTFLRIRKVVITTFDFIPSVRNPFDSTVYSTECSDQTSPPLETPTPTTYLSYWNHRLIGFTTTSEGTNLVFQPLIQRKFLSSVLLFPSHLFP